jgi:hypothetical protein
MILSEKSFRDDADFAHDFIRKVCDFSAPCADAIDEALMNITLVRVAIVMAMIGAGTAAIAQKIPSSEMPGRERERFTDPPQPLSRSGGSIFSRGSTYSPPGVKRRSHQSHARKSRPTGGR